MNMRLLSSLVLGCLVGVGSIQTVGAKPNDPKAEKSSEAKSVNKHHAYNLVGESIGLAGYDPVSYFPEGGGKPRRGVYDLTYAHDGVTWRFATAANLAAFKKSPEKYLPAFGGWCAFGVGEENMRFEADPENYVMRDGKVLVFYRDPKIDTKALYEKNAEEIYKKALANWPALSK